jgi:predicted GNAT family acetyltransferase
MDDNKSKNKNILMIDESSSECCDDDYRCKIMHILDTGVLSSSNCKRISYLFKDVIKNTFDHGFYIKDVVEYMQNKKVQKYHIKDVMHWIYKPCWFYTTNNANHFYSIYQTLSQKDSFKYDIKRIEEADTDNPIIVVTDEFDKYGSIFNGNHRFAKLILNNSKKVKFRLISKEELYKFLVKI